MLAFLTVLGSVVQLAVATPPAAYVDTGSAHVRLAIVSWCWDSRCGAPLGRSRQRVLVSRGATVHVALTFEPLEASVNVAGAHVKETISGHDVSWPATHAGGVTIYAKSRRGWVIYAARLALR